jgi:hypothetical protein
LFLVLLLAGAGGYLWLRNSAHWARITLYAEDQRVENFRSMHEIFPARIVPAGDDTWAFVEEPRGLPETYTFDEEERSLATFLDDTVTTGLIVVRNDVIAHEEYRLGGAETSLFTSFSIAKSVVSALVGIALEEGHIDGLDDLIVDYVPALSGSAYDGVTIEDALTMSSGVAFDEDYSNPLSDVNRLVITLGFGNLIDVLASLERVRAPGSYNDYISADTIALGLVLEAATGLPTEDYLETRLWRPMGAEAPALWNYSRDGRVLPFCCFNATLRDYARFGLLFLNHGARDVVQIVPAHWADISTRPTASRLEPGANSASSWTFGYGYQWWIPEGPRGAPGDEFMAIGIWGQYIYVDRRWEVVVVKTGADYDFDTRDHEAAAVFRAIADHVVGPGR